MHVNAISLHVFCGYNCKTSRIFHERSRLISLSEAAPTSTEEYAQSI